MEAGDVIDDGGMGRVETGVIVEVIAAFCDGESDESYGGVDELGKDGGGIGRGEVIENGGDELGSG